VTQPIDTTFTPTIVCPYCGHEQCDSSEIHDDTEMSCGECGREFFVAVHVRVSYSTRRLEQ
jgi:DNA-directed RNA polymerase subunit RPC12/RpoP